MAQVDVTALLTDPDFVDDMAVIDRVPKVNAFGENTLSERIRNSIGCVQPASGKTLQRVPEAMRNQDYSEFYWQGEIITTAPGKYSSILVFRGKRYEVKTVLDYSNWGAGWTQGLCVAEVPA